MRRAQQRVAKQVNLQAARAAARTARAATASVPEPCCKEQTLTVMRWPQSAAQWWNVMWRMKSAKAQHQPEGEIGV